MGVYYYHCKSCNESRYEEYVGWCNKCRTPICTSCVVNDDINDRYAYSYGYQFNSNNPELMKKYEEEGFELYRDGENIYESYGFADKISQLEINNEVLFDYIVEKYELSIRDEWNEYKSKKK